MPSTAAPGGCCQAPSWSDLGDIWGSQSRQSWLVQLKCRTEFTGGHLTGRAALPSVRFGQKVVLRTRLAGEPAAGGARVSPVWPLSSPEHPCS